jgi:inner membrane protein
MPTVFTHALVGAAVAGATPEPRPRGRLVVACAAAAVLPDADVLAFGLGIPYAHPLGHRGLTHAIPFAVLAGWAISRVGFGAYANRAWAAIALAMASHGVLDAFTNGGLGVGLALPFWNERFFFPWRPLEVSPIGASDFFAGDALRVLASEARFVMPPLAALLGVAVVRSSRTAHRPVRGLTRPAHSPPSAETRPASRGRDSGASSIRRG